MPRAGRPVCRVELGEAERGFPIRLSRKRNGVAAEAKRAKAILLMAEGFPNQGIAAKVGFCSATVGTLRKRFVGLRLEGISDLPRKIGDDRIGELIEKTLHSKPKGATHWGTRKMAKNIGFSHDPVSRIWRAFGLKPHRADTFQISTDPRSADKARDVVGLYVSPPENALVLCVDGKSQIQALQRSQPVLPMRAGKPEGHTPGYHPIVCRDGCENREGSRQVPQGASCKRVCRVPQAH